MDVNNNLAQGLTRLGFTLIELLVGITIMLSMIAVGWTSYARYNDRQQLVASGKSVVNELRLLQKRASSGDKPSICDSVGPLNGYVWELTDTDFTEMQMLVRCGGEDQNELAETYSLPTGTRFDDDAQEIPRRILFTILGRGAEFDLGGSSVTLNLEHDAIVNKQYRIVIYASGEIQDVGLVDQ